MTFKIANIKEDMKILMQAKEDSLEFLKSNSLDTLDTNSNIKKIIENIGNLN